MVPGAGFIPQRMREPGTSVRVCRYGVLKTHEDITMSRKHLFREWILARLLSPAVRRAAIEDFEERWRSLREQKGLLAASGWYWLQIVCLFLERFRDLPGLSLAMFRNYLRVSYRGMKRHAVFSVLNITGLAVGLTTFILIALYVQYELSYDRYHEQADRLYRVVRDEYVFTPPPLGPRLVDQFPEVSAAARIIRDRHVLVSHGESRVMEDELYWADPGIFGLFTIHFRQGDPRTALRDPGALVISEGIARKYFGDEDPIGQTLALNGRHHHVITGVFETMPVNSHLRMDLIAPLETWFRRTGNDRASWRSNYVYTYLLLRPEGDPQSLQDKFPDLEKQIMAGLGITVPDSYRRTFSIQPVTEIHLHSHRQQEVSINNDMSYIVLFVSIAFLVLLIAAINYMNLATARAIPRSKEVVMRKIVGAARGQLVRQFLGESLVMTTMALGLSLLLAAWALPTFNTLVQRALRFEFLFNPSLALLILSITLVLGLLAGAYPAILISGFRPVSVLSRTSSRSPRTTWLRNILVLVQFSATIILIICTLVVRDQLEFMETTDVGFRKDQIVTLPVRDSEFRQNIQTIEAELLRHPNVTTVSVADSLPNNIETFTRRDWTGRQDAEPVPIYYTTVDYDFVDLFGIEIIEGRNFSRDFPADAGGAFLVNETAVRTARWDHPLGREFQHWRGDKGRIVGVMKDFHLQSLHQPIAPLYIFLDPATFSHLSIKVQPGNLAGTLRYIETVFQKFSPNSPFIIRHSPLSSPSLPLLPQTGNP